MLFLPISTHPSSSSSDLPKKRPWYIRWWIVFFRYTLAVFVGVWIGSRESRPADSREAALPPAQEILEVEEAVAPKKPPVKAAPAVAPKSGPLAEERALWRAKADTFMTQFVG